MKRLHVFRTWFVSRRRAMLLPFVGVVATVTLLLLAALPGSLGRVRGQTGPAVVIVPISTPPSDVESAPVVSVEATADDNGIATATDLSVQPGTETAVTATLPDGTTVTAAVFVPADQPPVAVSLSMDASGVGFAATGAPGSTFFIQAPSGDWVAVTIPSCGSDTCAVQGTVT